MPFIIEKYYFCKKIIKSKNSHMNHIWKFSITLVIACFYFNVMAQTEINAEMPKNGAVDVNVGILRWTGKQEMNYDLYFGATANPQLYKSDLTEFEEKPVILELNKTYYWRVVEKKNGKEVRASKIFSFSTLPISLNPNLKYQSFVDVRDYKVYWTIVINKQEWMVQNLDYKLPNQAWYYDNTDNNKIYGFLYLGTLLQNSMNTICPEGWHIPTQQEWTELMTSFGGIKTAGSALKEAGVKHWRNSNYQRTNASGFTILPAGSGNSKPSFSNLGKYAFFWTSTPNKQKPGNFYKVDFGFMRDNAIIGVGDVNWSYSIRCVRDVKK